MKIGSSVTCSPHAKHEQTVDGPKQRKKMIANNTGLEPARDLN